MFTVILSFFLCFSLKYSLCKIFQFIENLNTLTTSGKFWTWPTENILTFRLAVLKIHWKTAWEVWTKMDLKEIGCEGVTELTGFRTWSRGRLLWIRGYHKNIQQLNDFLFSWFVSLKTLNCKLMSWPISLYWRIRYFISSVKKESTCETSSCLNPGDQHRHIHRRDYLKSYTWHWQKKNVGQIRSRKINTHNP